MAKSKKKWADLKGALPYLPADASYGDDLITRQRELEALPIKELSAAYEQARLASEAAEEAKKQAGFEEEASERALMAVMERLGLESVGIEGFNYSPTLEPYPSIKDRDTFVTYAIEHFRSRLALPHQSLKSICKSALEGDGEVPPGVDMYLKRKFSRTKA